MEFFDVVEARHSYKGQYEDVGVPDGDVVKILEAGLCAPSGCNAQTTEFIVVTNVGLRAEIAKLYKSELVSAAPVIIVAITKKVTFDFGLDFELEDYSAAVENILLAITALGYATRWLDGDTRLEGKDLAIAKLLDVPEGYVVRTIMPVGKPKSPGKRAPKKAFEERVTWRR